MYSVLETNNMINYQIMEESMKTRKNSITTNYIYNMIFQVLNLLLPFITTPYVSRVLKADNIGIYSYTYSIITTFVLVGSLGVATYGQKEIAAVCSDQRTGNNHGADQVTSEGNR